jgi:pyrroline-5-carboxylate reductase
MPNTPASIGEGLTSVYAPELSPANRAILETLLAPLGQTMPLHDEALMHAITAVSGSGPAYLFAFMEAMMVAAQSLGLSEAEARASVTQTMRGAALLADQAAGDVSRLRREVTSPAGTTAAALAVFEAKHLQQAVMEALRAAATRSQELA